MFYFTDNTEFNFDDLGDVWEYYLASEYLDDVIEMRKQEVVKESEAAEKVIKQYDIFTEKATPYLQLNEL